MTSSALARHLATVAQQHDVLDCPSPLHAGAFVYGYLLVVPGLSWLNDALDTRFSGPAQARAWTRAYLTHGDDKGLARVLEAAVSLLVDPRAPVATLGNGNPESFVDVVLDAIDVKRPATVLGECTVSWLYNYGLGAQAATADHFPALARERSAKLANFERWLQDYYELPGAPWQRLLRAFEGPGERAVYRFAALWREHLDG